jgi:3'-5' exoribonuclease
VLHDIGKIYELNYERGFSYSDDGQLLGHINIALRMVAEKLHGLPEFPAALRTLVEHMVLSHHGHLEFGSPKLPQFPEALLLHYLDDMDSKMECMRALIENDRQVEGCFTSFYPALERAALKKERFLDPPPVPVRAAGPAGPDFAANGGAPESRAAVASPAAATHPLFAAQPESAFADKLRNALAVPPLPPEK